MKRKVLYMLAVLSLLPAVSHILRAEELFTGDLYRMGSDRGELLFRQYNEQDRGQKIVTLTHEYTLADGTPYALEEVVRENGEFRDYRIEFYLLDTRGTIVRDGEDVMFDYRAGDEWERGAARFKDDLMCGPCLIGFIQANWNRLMSGRAVRFHLPVMQYQRLIPFRFRKDDESPYVREGRVVFRMEIASFILGLFIGSVDFVFEEETRRLVEIHGPSILKVEEQGIWRYVEVDAYYTYDRVGARINDQ
jgi:hypothetical protein